MKLNKEALRQMMIILQRLPIEPDTILTNKAIDESSKETGIVRIDYFYALKQAIDYGLVEGERFNYFEDPLDLDARNFLIKDITPVGHEFIDSITDEANWHKVKEYLKENKLPLTVSMISRAIARSVLKSQNKNPFS
ncbi:DUF2513 domain-containing protein [Oenococcus oeni]|nr:DUF2513 domain-containing protein [Oenococcus oeni]TEU59065.1 DUF2513 domain-containing protein [Oenococcus oeni]TEU59300.1 DUF2513 domain-containing protein [Oenococcus oeni]